MKHHMPVRRVRRAYGAALLGAAVLAIAVSLIALRGGGDEPTAVVYASPGDGAAGSFAISPPESRAELSAKAEIVVIGTVGKQLETHAVPLGQSAPLGEQGRVSTATIDIASYELRVDQYLAGSGERTISLQHAVNLNADGVDAGAPVPGEKGIFFLSPAKEWGLGGYASYFGRYGRLIERDGRVVYAGADAQTPAFAKDTTLAQLAAIR